MDPTLCMIGIVAFILTMVITVLSFDKYGKKPEEKSLLTMGVLGTIIMMVIIALAIAYWYIIRNENAYLLIQAQQQQIATMAAHVQVQATQ
jgi:multisubunit Na+/H+ antiporter MnhB subunit